MNYYKENDLNKNYRNQYGNYEFIPERFVSKFFDEKRENLTCKVKGYCINSLTPYCRVCRNWDINHVSPFERVYEDCYYLRNDNEETAYKHAFNKVAWGACAFFFYVKWFDDRGRSRYEWSSNIRGIEKCRQYYFDTCYNIYKAQNRNAYGYYEENNIIDKFKAEFAKQHIESERKLIERTVNTKDIFEEYDKALEIRQEAEEYLEWVRSTYLPSQAEITETDKRDDYLLNKICNRNEAIYDEFLKCKGLGNTLIVYEIIAIMELLHKGKQAHEVFVKKELRKKLKELHFKVAKESTFNGAFNYRQRKTNVTARKKIDEAKTKYQKLSSQKL